MTYRDDGNEDSDATMLMYAEYYHDCKVKGINPLSVRNWFRDQWGEELIDE